MLKQWNCCKHLDPRVISTLSNLIRRAEEALLALMLTSMIGIAAAQVVMRNFFDGGLYWGDSAVRVIVLWVALFGAMVASRHDEHIRIDIIGHLLPEQIKVHVSRLVYLFTSSILMLFAWYSVDFIRYEYEDGTIAFGSVPAWMCEVVMPVGTGIMAFRYLLLAIFPSKAVNR